MSGISGLNPTVFLGQFTVVPAASVSIKEIVTENLLGTNLSTLLPKIKVAVQENPLELVKLHEVSLWDWSSVATELLSWKVKNRETFAIALELFNRRDLDQKASERGLTDDLERFYEAFLNAASKEHYQSRMEEVITEPVKHPVLMYAFLNSVTFRDPERILDRLVEKEHILFSEKRLSIAPAVQRPLFAWIERGIPKWEPLRKWLGKEVNLESITGIEQYPKAIKKLVSWYRQIRFYNFPLTKEMWSEAIKLREESISSRLFYSMVEEAISKNPHSLIWKVDGYRESRTPLAELVLPCRERFLTERDYRLLEGIARAGVQIDLRRERFLSTKPSIPRGKKTQIREISRELPRSLSRKLFNRNDFRLPPAQLVDFLRSPFNCEIDEVVLELLEEALADLDSVKKHKELLREATMIWNIENRWKVIFLLYKSEPQTIPGKKWLKKLSLQQRATIESVRMDPNDFCHLKEKFKEEMLVIFLNLGKLDRLKTFLRESQVLQNLSDKGKEAIVEAFRSSKTSTPNWQILMVQALIENGWEIDQTYLEIAFTNGFWTVANQLLVMGAPLPTPSADYPTQLHRIFCEEERSSLKDRNVRDRTNPYGKLLALTKHLIERDKDNLAAFNSKGHNLLHGLMECVRREQAMPLAEQIVPLLKPYIDWQTPSKREGKTALIWNRRHIRQIGQLFGVPEEKLPTVMLHHIKLWIQSASDSQLETMRSPIQKYHLKEGFEEVRSALFERIPEDPLSPRYPDPVYDAILSYPNNFTCCQMLKLTTSQEEIIRDLAPLAESEKELRSLLQNGLFAIYIRKFDEQTTDAFLAILQEIIKVRLPELRNPLLFAASRFLADEIYKKRYFATKKGLVRLFLTPMLALPQARKLLKRSQIRDPHIFQPFFVAMTAIHAATRDDFETTLTWEDKQKLLCALLPTETDSWARFISHLTVARALIQMGRYRALKDNPTPARLKEALRQGLNEILGEFSVPNADEAFIGVFGEFRDPTAFIRYAAGLTTLREPEMLLTALKEVMEALFTDSVATLRYENLQENAVTEYFKERGIEAEWRKGEEIPLANGSESEGVSMLGVEDFRKELKDAVQFGHLGDYKPLHLQKVLEKTMEPQKALKQMNKKLEDPQKSTLYKLERLLIRLLIPAKVEKVKGVLTTLKKVLSKLNKQLAIAGDIEKFQQIIRQAEKSTSGDSLGDRIVVDTDDPREIILAGTEVLGSCVSIDNRKPAYNQNLLGYLRNGHTRMVAVKDVKTGKILARTMIRRGWDEKSKAPILLFERMYFRDASPAMREALLRMCQRRARALGLKLVSANAEYASEQETYEVQLYCDNTPVEYFDSYAGGTRRGTLTTTVYDVAT